MTSLMIDSLAPSKKASGPRPLPKAGTQIARVLHVVDLGTHARKPFKGEEKTPARMLWINYELLNDRFEMDGEQVPHRISGRKYNVFNDPKSALFKYIAAIDPGGEMGGDLGKLPNKPCLVTIIHVKAPNKLGEMTNYANITNVSPVPDGLPIPEATDKPCLFSYDSPNKEALVSLPAFIRDDLKLALEYPGSEVEKMITEIENAIAESKDEVPY